MTKEDVDKFARKNNIYLCEEELDFLYRFVKKNYEALKVILPMKTMKRS